MKTLRDNNLNYYHENSHKTLKFCFNMMCGFRYLTVDQYKPASVKSFNTLRTRAAVKFVKTNVYCERSVARGKESAVGLESSHWSNPIYGAFQINSDPDTSLFDYTAKSAKIAV